MRRPILANDVIHDLAVTEGFDGLQRLHDAFKNRRPERESDDFDFNVFGVRFDYVAGTASFASILGSPDEADEVISLDHAIQRIEAELAAGPTR